MSKAMPTRPFATAQISEGNAPVQNGLVAVSAELRRIAASAESLQLLLSPALHRLGPEAMTMQSLDEITQLLQGLTSYVGAIADQCSREWQCDLLVASAQLSVHAQRRRLALQDKSSGPVLTEVSGNELELW